jgi:prostaglandin-E synthase
MASTAKHPIVLWAQRDALIYLTVEVEDMKIETLDVSGNKFHIKGTSGSGQKYEADLELHDNLKGGERRQIATSRHVELVIPKETNGWWPRLLKGSGKVPWIKVDFGKWKDEDEEAEETGAGAGGFGDFDFSSLGLPGGAGGPAGGADFGKDLSDDEDDEDMPDLEDAEEDDDKKAGTAAAGSSSTVKADA